VPRFLDRLGVRVLLTILVFLAALGLATALLVAAGFHRAQSSAAERSREGLQSQGAGSLLQLAQHEAELGDALLRQAAAQARLAAGYLAAAAEERAGPACDPLAPPSGETAVYRSPGAAAGAGPCASLALDALFPSLVRESAAVTAAYYVSAEGLLRAYPAPGSWPPGYRPTAEPFFLQAAPAANPGRETVWVEGSPDPPTLLVSTPVYHGNAFRGVVALEVALREVQAQLESLSPTAGGYALLVREDGRLAAAPPAALRHALGGDGNGTDPLAAEFSLEQASDPGIRRAWQAMRAGAPGLEEIQLGGQQVFLAYAPLPTVRWSLGIVAPVEEMTAQAGVVAEAIRRDATSTVYGTLLLMGAFFLIALAATAILSRAELTRPIETLSAATRAVAGGDLRMRIPTSARDELGLLAGSFNEMTARLAEAGERLAEKEEQYRSIVEATSDGLMINDLEGAIVEANPAFCRMHGYAYEELMGTPAGNLVHPDHQAQFHEYLAAARRGHPYRHVGLNVRRDGSAFHVTVHGTPLTYRGEAHILAVIRDVTDRVLAQQQLEQNVADRTRELSALYDVAAVASTSLGLSTVLERSLERVLEVMGCTVGGFYLLDESGEMLQVAAWQGAPPAVVDEFRTLPRDQGFLGWIVSHGEPLVVRNVLEHPQSLPFTVPGGHSLAGALAFAGAPVHAKGEILGALGVVSRPGRQFTAEEVALLASIADQVGVAAENARLYQQAEQLAVLQERERLARDLHDSVTQSLYSANLMVETARRAAQAGDMQDVERYLLRLGEVHGGALKEMRLLLHQLRPLDLEGEGLLGALQKRLDSVEARTGVETRLLIEGELALAPAAEEALYRIAVEALNNTLKHAGAAAVTVHLRQDGSQVELAVVDNGHGFCPAEVEDRGGMGLLTMRQRAERLGGSLDIDSVPGEGTIVRVTLNAELPAGTST
jgi:PAS domain S-box-containing protein